MRFLSQLDLRAYEPGEWVVLSDQRYESSYGSIFTVRRGFITDLASIPRLLRSVYDINGKSRQAAVLHDFLYCAQLTTRVEADRLFLEALESLGIGWATRWSMYLGVRSGGWIYWNKRSKGLATDDFVPAEYFG
ncbi:DUF1353 domain-containing protein [Pseudomonas resinovorans]|uniref:DUF1353 domain-containing protein n=1 Tax=Metapseudomonas resinovorans TaxID=53412 RepID=A0ABT4Y8E5_METRE|nr:DUF1353 domain-containing protein [Pseudomonas resinovorans]MDA8485149.1 DUF1353 domain-containing protein [Pseudomonas resinovorans]